MKKNKRLAFQAWLATKDKATWLYAAGIAFFVCIAIAALFVWMHLSGYTFAEWFARFWPTVVICLAAIVAGALFLVFRSMKKRY